MSNEADFAWLGEAPKVYKFYNDAVSVFYDDPSHRYYRYDDTGNEITIPGVTTAVHIIDKSAALTQWSANMSCDYIREQITLLDIPFETPQPFTPELVISWLDKAKYAHRDYKDNAADTGKIAHDWIEQYIHIQIAIGNSRSEKDAGYWAGRTSELLANMPEDERALNGAKAALDWMTAHSVRWVYTERKIYSRTFDYAGTLDGLAYITACGDPKCCGHYEDLPDVGWTLVADTFVDVLAITDWKTSNRLYPEYHYQTAAYLKALCEELGLEIDYRVIVRLGKEDAEFESRLLHPDTLERDFTIYVGCLVLYKAVEEEKATDKALKTAVKEAKAAAKEREVEAIKAERLRIRTETKEARAFAKTVYKQWRTDGLSVKEAEAKADTWLTVRLAAIGGSDEEDLLEIAA